MDKYRIQKNENENKGIWKKIIDRALICLEFNTFILQECIKLIKSDK